LTITKIDNIYENFYIYKTYIVATTPSKYYYVKYSGKKLFHHLILQFMYFKDFVG